MLLRLAQLLNPLDDILILLALHGNRDGQTTEYERGSLVVVLRHGLQVRHIEGAGRLVQHVRKVLRDEPVQPLEGAESQDPVVR